MATPCSTLGWVLAAALGTALCFTLPPYISHSQQLTAAQVEPAAVVEKPQLVTGKCDTPDKLRRFVRQFDETLVGRGSAIHSKRSTTYELYLNRDYQSSWSIVEIAQGQACVKFTGSDVQQSVQVGTNGVSVFSAQNTLVKSPSSLKIKFMLSEKGWAIQTDSATLLEGVDWHFLSKQERAAEDHRFDETI